MTEENEKKSFDPTDPEQRAEALDQIDDKMRDLPENVDFHVNDMPREAFEKFKELAEEEFNDYYGLTIKFLILNYEQDKNVGQKLERMQQRIDRLQHQFDQVIDQLNQEGKADKNESDRLNT